MTRRVLTLRPQDAIHRAISTLVVHDLSAAPVVDRRGRLVGLLSEHDALAVLANLSLYRAPGGGTVADYMTPDPVTVDPLADLLCLAERLRSRGFRRLPVVDAHDRLVGVVTRRDVLRGIQELDARTPRHVDVPLPH